MNKEVIIDIENHKDNEQDDVISREAVIEAITKHMDGEDKNCKLQLSSCVEWIRDLPPVTPKSIDCEDAVDREELLKAIDTWDKFGCDDTNSLFRLDNLSLPYYVPYIHYDDVIKCIKGMPPVTQKSNEQLYMNGFADGYEQGHKDAEQKSGKWIPGINWKCNNCGFVDSGAHGFNYCPNCGAKMESEDKGKGEIHCNCTDEEIAKSFIEDVEAVKELLPQAESEK